VGQGDPLAVEVRKPDGLRHAHDRPSQAVRKATPLPGFATEIQGAYPGQDEHGRVRLFSYVIRE